MVRFFGIVKLVLPLPMVARNLAGSNSRFPGVATFIVSDFNRMAVFANPLMNL
jgi:hypothetical protein